LTTAAENMCDDGTLGYVHREAVGVFDNADALEAAVDELEISGFDRAAISVLASDKTVKDRLGRLYRSVAEIVDDPRAPLAAFVSKDSRVEGEAATVGVPLFIGGIAGGLAVVASGGALAAAFVLGRRPRRCGGRTRARDIDQGRRMHLEESAFHISDPRTCGRSWGDRVILRAMSRYYVPPNARSRWPERPGPQASGVPAGEKSTPDQGLSGLRPSGETRLIL
jgi:hypothetical protein